MILNLMEKFQQMGITNEWMTVYAPLKNTSGDVGWVEKKILEAKKKFDIGAVVIDHLGFLLPKSKGMSSTGNYSVYLGQICRELKTIALDQEVIIILPVHMRKTDNPTINDIYSSVGIAQESDIVFTLSREEDDDDSSEFYTNYSKITLAKNRKTGISLKGWFTLNDGRFVYDAFYKGKAKKKKPNYFTNSRKDYMND
jgi:hypothetical protein